MLKVRENTEFTEIISYLESVPSFIISEDNKLKYNMQCFRNVA